MPFYGRSVHYQLKKKNIRRSKSAGGRTTKKGADLDTTDFKAANHFLTDGIDVPMQGQMVDREVGGAVKVHGKANFGKLITPELLKLEAGAYAEASVAGKRTILVFRGPEVVHGTSSKNELPIVISCMEGVSIKGGVGLEATVGVGIEYGAAAIKGQSGKGVIADTSHIADNSDEPDPLLEGTIAEAKVEFFAGIKGEINGAYDYYLAYDHTPMFMKKTESSKANVRPVVDRVLKKGNTKDVLKERACKFINKNPGFFGGRIQYRKNIFGAHVSTAAITSRLAAGKDSLPPNSPKRFETEELLRQLRPWDGRGSEYKDMTYLRIKSPQVAASASVGATIEASATTPLFSLGAEAGVDLVNVSGSHKRVYLKNQVVCAAGSAHPLQLYWHDLIVKFSNYSLNLGQARVDLKAGALGREVSLNEFVKSLQEGGRQLNGLENGLVELSKWSNFGKIEGTSASIFGIDSSTMSYMGATAFWNKPTKEAIFGSPPRFQRNKPIKKRIKVNALRGTGMIHGATFTVGVLSRSYAALKTLQRVLVNIQKFWRPGDLEVEHIKQSVRAANEDAKIMRFLNAANAFKKEFVKYAAIISCRPYHLAKFLLEGAGEIAAGIGYQLGEEAGVLVEAAFPALPKQRKKLLEVKCTLYKDKKPTFVLGSSNQEKIVKTVRDRAKLNPSVMRLRYRFQEEVDRHITLPIGISIKGVAEAGLDLTSVWNMQVDGITVLNDYYFKQRARAMSIAEQRDFVPPPPMLFTV